MTTPQANMRTRIPLATNWQFKQNLGVQNPILDSAHRDDDQEWMPASVPGTVHQDLMAAGRIPDPFLDLNENLVQEVGESDWDYRCQFDVPETFLIAEHIALCFDGLDTFATVWLNGQQIFIGENMFVPVRLEVKKFLKVTNNQLLINFESAFWHGKDLELKHGKYAAWNGDPSRVYVRKAQYHYGWDWGPCLITAGIWRPVYLESYDTRIADVHIPVEVSPDLATATLPVSVLVENPAAGQLVTMTIYDPSGNIVNQVSLPVVGSKVVHIFQIPTPILWYPSGYGTQARYLAKVVLSCDKTELDRQEKLIGLRRLCLVQEPLIEQPGKSFLFEINNIPVFCGGANWIPGDLLRRGLQPKNIGLY